MVLVSDKPSCDISILQIPPDLVVKIQAIDIAGVIL
jgi:hypothetical protein